MSKSRLEKFLYALYSLDSSDLPTPLSRIEELYKCWVTGEEAPSFEPISRVEKYLMAILGGYDVDSLPNPLSRVEVLLYKLATGDDSLEDFDTFLSEHEELLAEIIRNGGVGGNIDIEYVLYTLSTEFNTLYNTAEKPIKSAILKGSTLVNLLNKSNIKITNSAFSIINYAHNLDTTKTYILQYRINQIPELTDATDSGRLFKFEWYSGTLSGGNTNIYIKNITVGASNFIIIKPFTGEVLRTSFGVWCPNHVSGTLDIDIMIIEYQDGMENWDIPYFEGMQSVKMPVLKTTGKNLFEVTKSNGYYSHSNGNWINNEGYKTLSARVLPNTNYTQNIKTNNITFWKDGVFVGGIVNSPTFTTPTNCNEVRVSCPTTLNTFMLEKGSISTSYEPYKSNILTVNEDIELRKVGNIQDELNLLTGELTQRIGEVVLDGSEVIIEWENTNVIDGIKAFSFRNCADNNTTDVNSLSDTYITYKSSGKLNMANGEGISITSNHCYLKILTSKLETSDIDGLKKYLSQNPITVQYELAEESVKTVDLSTVNQDGNNTKLKTFDDITHVTLSSEGLIPEAELEVATKNEEDLEDSIVYTVHTLSEEHNTLYNTAEKPVKSAFLKGNTMVNIAQITSHNFDEYRTPVQDLNKPLEIGKQYTIIVNIVSQTVKRGFTLRFGKDNSFVGIKTFNGVRLHKFLYNATNDFNQIAPYIELSEWNEGLRLEYNQLMIIEGDYTNVDIPYFEGMQSVKMPVLTISGKNLFNVELEHGSVNTNNGTLIETMFAIRSKDFIKLSSNETFTISKSNGTQIITVVIFDKNYKFVRALWEQTFTLTGDEMYVKIADAENDLNNQYQIEKGKTPSSYEPYKSNILTVNEPVELRGIGEVKDELNLVTGEVTRRIGEVVLDGSEVWGLATTKEKTQVFELGLSVNQKINNAKPRGLMMCDKIKVASGIDDEIIVLTTSFYLGLLKTKASTIEELNVYLSQNPITIQYETKKESVKTVDLSVVDQDGNDTKLSTFDDITHVTLSSEGLIPEAELEVAEKVTEVAASMLTISREQEVIDTTTNEQSENVDATMIATTEIYEELL